jgi:hypothetical protein
MKRKRTPFRILCDAKKDLDRVQMELSNITESDLKHRFSIFEVIESVTDLGKAVAHLEEAIRFEKTQKKLLTNSWVDNKR